MLKSYRLNLIKFVCLIDLQAQTTREESSARNLHRNSKKTTALMSHTSPVQSAVLNKHPHVTDKKTDKYFSVQFILQQLKTMNLIPLQPTELRIEHPVQWDLYDQDNKLLLKRGTVIKTENELKQLSGLSIFRKQNAQSKKSDSENSASRQFNFDDLKLKVGDKLQIKLNCTQRQANRGNTNGYSAANVIGYVQDKTIIITIPNLDSHSGSTWLEHDQVLVRFFNGQHIFSFSVFVEYIAKLPFRYIHLSFPKQILGQAIRNSVRIRSDIAAEVKSNQDTHSGQITNLSFTGAEISVHADLGESGSTVDITFGIGYQEIAPLSLRAVIRSSRISQNDSDQLIYGIEFVDLTPDQIVALRSHIYKEILDNPGIIT